MPPTRIPVKKTSGVLVLDPDGAAVDLSCHVRWGAILSDGGDEVDLGTFCDPTASVITSASKSFDVEWLNSFSDGTDDGLYDLLAPFVGTSVTVEFAPLTNQNPIGGTLTDMSFRFDTYIPDDVIGQFQTDQAIIVNTSWGVANLAYTKATQTP